MPTIIISLGGSVIIPEKLDVQFIKEFKELILEYVNKGYKFVIYCGGGKLAREYQSSAKRLSNITEEDLDWLGIYTTLLNAYFLKSSFGDYANKEIITNPTKKIIFSKPISIAGGWKPGWSTDYDAVLVAKQLNINKIINVSNVNYIYDKDPKKFKSAKPIKKISWRELINLFSSEWKPGLNLPFDPIACKEAERSKIMVILIGKDINNLRNTIEDKDFNGSIVHL